MRAFFSKILTITCLWLLCFTYILATAGSIQYTYDNQGRLVSVESPGKYRIQYSYDPAGNRISKTVELSSNSFDSDGDGDIDGKDLSAFINTWDGTSESLSSFAAVFGTD
ncbi:MAG: hypothetical protein B1H11_10805 [Desulfobacteraceae bacterium 4484_190.1]|nr:MAG: hypothetical protein B1H11_10805 [Desulfobacteraceae bacterium 4484_190.1]